MSFGHKIISWYRENHRDLPWRRTRDPYLIWLSEIILQQTRVEQGLSYYNRFVKAYPNVKKLARADEEEVLKNWQGLGYYSRARNLHAAARDIVNRFGGVFPTFYEDILSLKGVGVYTAAAIASFTWDLPYPVVDGNVYRVLSRYLGISTPVNTPGAAKEFSAAARELMAGHPPSEFNQAIMEFGALHCKPANPSCGDCPLRSSCFAFAKNKVKHLPLKKKKPELRNRYLHYFYIRHGKSVYLRRRTENDIWKNLYDFPLIESGRQIRTEKMFLHKEWKQLFSGKGYTLLGESRVYRHLLSHQRLFIRFFEVRASVKPGIPSLKKVSQKNLEKYPVPRPVEEYIKMKTA